MLSGLTTVILRDFAIQVIDGIKDNIKNKQVTPYGAMETTGKMAESLAYKIDGSGLTIFSSEKYFTVLETGRKPGKRPPTDVVETWIKNKNIVTDISTESLAFLIARKIGEEGSIIYKQGGKSGVISDYINDEYIKENLTNVLTETFRNYVINEFINKSATA